MATEDERSDRRSPARSDRVPAAERPGHLHPPPGTAVSARTHAEGTVGSDRRFFEDAEPGSLKDQQDLIDAEGDDIRMYTGEPVETDDGWILPQQMNVPGNSAGGGEFPDPATPSTQPRDRPPEPADDTTDEDGPEGDEDGPGG